MLTFLALAGVPGCEWRRPGPFRVRASEVLGVDPRRTRIAVYQKNGLTKIATIRPTALLGLFPNPELQPGAQEVEAALTRIMDDLA